MALVSAKEMIEKAHEGHYAVGAFNINNMEWIKSCLLYTSMLDLQLLDRFDDIGGDQRDVVVDAADFR